MLREVLSFLDACHAAAEPVALATVVEVWGSAPRQPGARMAVSASGQIAGSVSGGCVEGAVVTEARAVLASGEARLVRYGVSNEEAWAVGLSCGGAIEIFLERVEPPQRDPVWAAVRDAILAERAVTLGTVIAGPDCGKHMLLDESGALAAEAAASGRPVRDAEMFVERVLPRPSLVAVGAVHVAVSLVRIAAELGFRTTVIDPRAAFARPERFAHADALLVEWPEQALPRVGLNEATAVAVLAHDPKIDVPALEIALRSPARYVGALGSSRTQAKRSAALREAGLTDDEIARIRTPIGLDLGGRRPEEIALAIAAEIVATGYGRR